VVLLGRLSTPGESLHKALQSICAVKWIARKSEFRANPLAFPFHIVREFLRLLSVCQSVPEGRRPTVIVHFIGMDTIPAFAARKVMGCRVMLYAVGPDVPTRMNLARRLFFKWSVRNADVVLCGSARVEERVRRAGGTTTRVLPIPFIPFELGVDRKKEFDVVTVGGLDEQAKQSLLVEASSFLEPSVKIAIVGEGPEREYLTTLSRRDGRNQVRFLGDLPPKRVQRTLQSSSLYVQCSRDESRPSPVLEAVCCGLPIIALNGNQDPELSELYGIRSIVPKDRRADSLATAIEEAMKNYPTLLEDVSKNRAALETFTRSWPGMAEAAIFS
jgi:glycosyltransferase involved in cell wall biosynthesis